MSVAAETYCSLVLGAPVARPPALPSFCSVAPISHSLLLGARAVVPTQSSLEELCKAQPSLCPLVPEQGRTTPARGGAPLPTICCLLFFFKMPITPFPVGVCSVVWSRHIACRAKRPPAPLTSCARLATRDTICFTLSLGEDLHYYCY